MMNRSASGLWLEMECKSAVTQTVRPKGVLEITSWEHSNPDLQYPSILTIRPAYRPGFATSCAASSSGGGRLHQTVRTPSPMQTRARAHFNLIWVARGAISIPSDDSPKPHVTFVKKRLNRRFTPLDADFITSVEDWDRRQPLDHDLETQVRRSPVLIRVHLRPSAVLPFYAGIGGDSASVATATEFAAGGLGGGKDPAGLGSGTGVNMNHL